MVERRDILRSVMGLAASGPVIAAAGAAETPKASAAKPSKATGIKHRRYSGKVLYITDGKGEMGRELFTVTIQPDGMRTMRAMCEMDDDQLLRDVVMTLDRNWHPATAFVQLTINQVFQGATWYRFTNSLIEAEGWNIQQGRFAQQFAVDGPIASFGAHPLHGDSWALARIRQAKGDYSNIQIQTYASSTASNGGTGPNLTPIKPGYTKFDYIGPEKVTVPAGTFTAEHFRFTILSKNDALDVWSYGEDCIPILLTSSLLKQRYELVELSGDPR